MRKEVPIGVVNCTFSLLVHMARVVHDVYVTHVYIYTLINE